MKIKDLIEKLKEFDPDLDIFCTHPHHYADNYGSSIRSEWIGTMFIMEKDPIKPDGKSFGIISGGVKEVPHI